MNLIHISYTSVLQFLTVAKYMNMNQAAKELFISQPALSLSISKLEKSLGITLFYRDKSKLVLSKDAERLMPYFEDFRKSHDILIHEVSVLKEAQAKSISISFTGSPYTYSALFYSNTLSQYNNGNVSLSYMNSSMAQSMLLTGHIDFAISVIPLSHPLISYTTLMAEPIGITMPFCHPKANLDQIDYETLSTLKIHGLEKKNAFRQLCDQLCLSQGITLNYETEDSYQEYTKRMEAGNRDCVFFTTKRNFEDNFKPLGGYIYKEINDDVFCRYTNIYYLSQDKMQYQHGELISLIQTNMIQYALLTDRFSRLINDEFL